MTNRTNAELADEADKCVDLLFHGNVLVPPTLLAQIIAALRRSEPDLFTLKEQMLKWIDARREAETEQRPNNNIHKRRLLETWGQVRRYVESIQAERQPSSDKVLVPRVPTLAMLEAGRISQSFGDEELDLDDMRFKWDAMLRAAEAEGKL